MGRDGDNHEKIEKARRNLLIVNCVLLILLFAEANIEALSAPGVAIKVTHPEVIIYFIWAAFFYENWRFYLLSRNNYPEFILRERKYLNNNKVLELLPSSGTAAETHYRMQFPHSLKIEKKLFKRILSFEYPGESRGPTNNSIKEINLLHMLRYEIKAQLKCLFLDVDSLEYLMPLLFSCLTVLVGIYKFFY